MRWAKGFLFLAGALLMAAQTESRVHVALTCAKSPCTFQIGEIIPIELSFTSTVPKRYQLNMASYDRSGRMGYEKFHVIPDDGARDPLRTYFAFGGFMGGGLTNFQFLSPEPVTIKLVLNEWISFDRPGLYRVKVTSARVTDATPKPNSEGQQPQITSNEIEVEIAPAAKEWQNQEFRRIVRALDDPKGTPAASGTDADPMTALRYLGTEDAARELARRFGTTRGNGDFQCMFGLIGSPNSAAGLAEMRTLLRDPDFPINSTFLRTMSYLPLRAGEPPEVLEKQQQLNMESARAALVEAAPRKRGMALAVSTETALEGLQPGVSDSLRKPLVQELMRSFDGLTPESQANWLQYRWDFIKEPAWIPVLKRLATTYQEFPELREMHAYQSLQVSGAALRHWHEMDPEGARRAVIAEIVRPKPRYGVDVLGMLKDESLPEVEWTLVENLTKTDHFEIEANILGLLERYGTGAAVSNLISSRGEMVGTWACAPQTSFLGYTLKFDPEAARPLIQRAIAARGQDRNACRQSLFVDVGAKNRSPVLEELARSSLGDPDPQVVISAATYLGRYGSAASEQPLWTRYLTWSRTWVGREQELRVTFGAGENPNLWEANLGQALAVALARGNGWLSDEPQLQSILDLAVGDYVRSAVDSTIRSSSGRSITYFSGFPDQPGWFSLAQYDQLSIGQLATKLLQFPPATTFRWSAAGPTVSADQEKAFRDVSEAAEKAGMKLIRE